MRRSSCEWRAVEAARSWTRRRITPSAAATATRTAWSAANLLPLSPSPPQSSHEENEEDEEREDEEGPLLMQEPLSLSLSHHHRGYIGTTNVTPRSIWSRKISGADAASAGSSVSRPEFRSSRSTKNKYFLWSFRMDPTVQNLSRRRITSAPDESGENSQSSDGRPEGSIGSHRINMEYLIGPPANLREIERGLALVFFSSSSSAEPVWRRSITAQNPHQTLSRYRRFFPYQSMRLTWWSIPQKP